MVLCFDRVVRVAQRFVKNPNVLFIRLLRGDLGHVKKPDSVVFKTTLSLNGETFALFGVGRHFGNKASFGHYTAYVKKLGSDPEEWYECNDEKLSHRIKLSCKNAIYMMYEKM